MQAKAVCVSTDNIYFARDIQEARNIWQSRHEGDSLTIYIQDRSFFYASTDQLGGLASMQSKVLSNGHRPSDEAIATFVYADKATLQCLAATGDERRFNKRDCVGKSLRYLDSEISTPRLIAIDQAIATGQPAEYVYTHYWQGETWHFRAVATHYPAEGEVMVEVFDLSERQSDWWANPENLQRIPE